MATPKKQEGSLSGLRYAIESVQRTVGSSGSFGILADDDARDWTKLEPNNYSTFGAEVTKIARNPISDDGQNSKGVLSDLNASAALNCDLTQSLNVMNLFEGFLWADFSEKPTTKPRHDTQIAFTAIDGAAEQFEAASGLDDIGLIANHLIYAYNLAAAANNGLHLVSAVAAGAVTVTTNLTADGAPAADAYFEAVGYQFASATLNVVVNGNVATLVRASGAVDFTTLGLEEGDVIFLGGDAVVNRFDNVDADGNFVNQGWAEVVSVTATVITLRDTSWPMTNETGAAVAATQTGTATGNFSNNEVVVVGAKTYTFKTTLTGAANEVLIGVSASASLDNLIYAINDAVGIEGTDYGTGTTANAQASAGAGAGDTIVLTALSAGDAGNSIASTETSATFSFAAATFSGGYDAKVIQLFFGHRLNNPTSSANRVRTTYQIERSLGPDDDASPNDFQYEYVVGAIPNEFAINVPAANKVTLDFSWIAKDREGATSAEGAKAGVRAALGSLTAFGTSGDVNRIKMAIIDDTDSCPDPLFEFLTEFKIMGNNNVKPNKSVGTLGAFEASRGNIDVKGTATAYFTTNAALNAIRANSSVYFSAQMVVENRGFVVTIPSMTLGGGPPDVKLNEPIMLPITFDADKNNDLGVTIQIFEFNYLPDLAAA